VLQRGRAGAELGHRQASLPHFQQDIQAGITPYIDLDAGSVRSKVRDGRAFPESGRHALHLMRRRAEPEPRSRIGRPPQLVERAVERQATGVEHEHPVRQQLDLIQPVRGEEQSGLGRDLPHPAEEVPAGARVEIRGRLVQQEHGGAAAEGEAEQGFLHHAARELVERLCARLLERHPERGEGRGRSIHRHSPQSREEGHELGQSHVVEGSLLRDVPDLAAHFLAAGGDRLPGHA
jgi:hypothetical protein